MNSREAQSIHLLEIDGAKYQIIKDGVATKIDPIVARLAIYFAKHPNVVLSRNVLAEAVWFSSYTSDDAINRSVSSLRKALGGQRGEFIKTIPKQGYSFSLPENTQLTIVEDECFNESPPLEQSAEKPVDDEAIVDSVKPVQINQLPTSGKANKLYFQIYGAMVLLALLTGVWFYSPQAIIQVTPLETASSHSSPVMVPNYNRKIGLYLDNWQVENAEQSLIDLRQSALAAVANEEQFELKPDQADADYEINVDLSRVDSEVKLRLTLIDVANQSTLDVANIRYVPSASVAEEDFLIAEFSAALRVFLLQSKYLTRYRGALKTMTFSDVEQFLLARDYLYLHLPGSRQKSEMMVEALNQRYPNNPYVLGLQINKYRQSITYREDGFIEIYQVVEDLIERTLQLDPMNSDALDALFFSHFHFVAERHKAEKAVQTAIKFHPYEQRTWRNYLFLKVKNATPCDELQIFIDGIPKGVFKPVRLKVIERIVNHCLGKTPDMDLMEPQLDIKLRGQEYKAILNHLYLFEYRHDRVSELVSKTVNRTNNPRRMLINYWSHLAMGDVAKAQVIAFEVRNELSEHSRWMMDIMDFIYGQAVNLDAKRLILADYSAIDRLADLYFIIALIQYQQQTGDMEPLQQYIAKRPPFIISVANRHEALAKMMVLRAAGEVIESQKVAQRLFTVLEHYRAKHTQSYHFYGLGRFQMLAAFYCEDDCSLKPSDPTGQLTKWFKPNHLYWMDDEALMTTALSSWPQHPVAMTYLERLVADKNRLKGKMGF